MESVRGHSFCCKCCRSTFIHVMCWYSEPMDSPPPVGPKPSAPEPPSTPMPKSAPHQTHSDTTSEGIPDTPTEKTKEAKELEKERKKKEKEEAAVKFTRIDSSFSKSHSPSIIISFSCILVFSRKKKVKMM